VSRLDTLFDALSEGARTLADCASVHLVGGPVRAMLLGQDLDLAPDLDFVVEGDARPLAALCAERWGGALVLHDRFKTATWDVPEAAGGPRSVDLVSARAESYARPGALPDVRPGSLDEDLRRRDFSLNAMALRVHPAPRGEIVDPVGGRADLAAGLLRILHPRSFEDDATRLLRLARLAVRLDLRMEEGTARAFDDAIHQDSRGLTRLDTVSGDRWSAEWRLLWDEPDPPLVVDWMAAAGLAAALGGGGDFARRALRRAWDGRARRDCPSDLGMALFAMLPERAGPEAATGREAGLGPLAVAARFGLQGWERKALLRRSDVALTLGARLRALPPLPPDDALEEGLLRSDESERTALVAACPDLQRVVEHYETGILSLPPLLTGDDLLAAGLSPGPALGESLRRVRRAQLRGELRDRGAALRLALGGPGAP
jgi:hypothetical protein